MSNPLISVLMSAYNAEKFVARAIQSILNQSYTNFEFIIINDGSTDKTSKIIKSFTDNRIIFINKKQNSGLIPALNHGLKIAKGEYITRMDADDESLERFKVQIDFMQKHQDIDVLGTAMFLVNGVKSSIITYPEKHYQCLDELVIGPCVSHPTVMMKKFILIGMKYNKNYPHAEDYKLWVDLAKNGAKFANLQTPLLKYYWHGDNMSIVENDTQRKSALMVQREYLTYFLGDSITNSLQKTLELLCNTNNTASLGELSRFYTCLDQSKKHAILRWFRKYIKQNVSAIDYKFNHRVNIALFAYYLKYKIKKHLRKDKNLV